MKRALLFFMVCLISLSGFTQVVKTAIGATVVQPSLTGEMVAPVKAGGDIIWQTTFDWANPADPNGWSLPAGWEIRDNSDLGNVWVWMHDSIKGRFTNERTPAHFVSGSDGFIVVPMDAYNYRDGIATENASDTYIVTPPIDCSGVSSVVIKLNQYYRFCCENDNTGHLNLMVTNDGGLHWANYDLSHGIGHNTFTPVAYRSQEFNISDVAAGMPNVQVKIYFCEVPYYFWAIDDLQLVEAYTNDLVLEDSWSEINFGFAAPIGHTNFVPFTQMGMNSPVSGKIGDFTFRGALLNSGMADAEGANIGIEVQKNGSEVFTTSSAARDIWTIERDTFETTEVFSPADYGDYQFNITAISDNGEDRPVNNSATYFFTVNDTLFQRADLSAESGTYTGVWANGNSAGDMLAVRYDIQQPCEINSITAYIYSFTASVNPSFKFSLLKYMAEDDEYYEVICSDVVTMEQSMLGWLTLPMIKDGESEFLEPGEYYAAWIAWGEDEHVGMRLGWDMNDRAEFTGYSLIYLLSIDTWYNSDKLPILGINLNNPGGPRQAPVTFNVDMTRHIANGEFHPGTDFVDITGTFNNWTGSNPMIDPEADGIYTLTVENLTIGEKIDYKYRINGNAATTEYPDGAARGYTVRYWNVLNDLYNGGVTTGINPHPLALIQRVYPNPTQGAITVEIDNQYPADLILTLSNIQGQVLYRNQVANVVSYRETINPKLAKGLYFLTIDNGREMEVHKVVVQ